MSATPLPAAPPSCDQLTALLVAAGVPARDATTVATKHPQPDPHDGSEHRHDQREQPERHRDAPEQEVERDVVPVLHHEDEEQATAGERGDQAAAETGALGRPTGSARALGAGYLLDHDGLLRHRTVGAA